MTPPASARYGPYGESERKTLGWCGFQLRGPKENQDVRHDNQRHEESRQETERKFKQRMHRLPVLESKAERRHDDKEDIGEANRVPDDEHVPVSSTG